MDPFAILRKEAARKRDETIRAARHECYAAMQRINDLQAQLGKRPEPLSLPNRKPLKELMRLCMPKDRLFTVNELADLLRAYEPGRVFTMATLRTHAVHLERRGVMRRVRRNRQMLWAAKEYKAPALAFGTMPLPQVAAMVLGDAGPLRLVELVVALRERGYRSHDDPKGLTKVLAAALSRRPEMFHRDKSERWSVV